MFVIIKYINRFARIFILLGIFWTTSCIYGQSPHTLTEYSTENGLSLNSVNDLLIDQQGFLWVATADGMQRFDGYKFQTFKHDDLDNKSLPENSVSLIYEDANGNFWITERAHIVFKPKGKIEFTDLTPSLPAFTFNFPLYVVAETDSSICIISYPNGIFAINKITLKIKKISAFTGFTDKDGIFMLTRMHSKDESSWFIKGTDKTGGLYNISATGIRHFNNENKIKLLFLVQYKKDSILIITDKMAYKASVQDPFAVSQILPTTFNAADFDNIYMTPRRVAEKKFFLIGTKKIWLFDTEQQKITPFPYTEYFSPELIRYLHISTTDSRENTWLGYNGIGGIKVISPRKFSLFNRPDKNALPYSLATNAEGKTFVGIYLGDIEEYDKDGQFIRKIKIPEADKKFGSPRAMAMIDSSTMIVKSVIDKLYEIDINKGSVKPLSYLMPPNTDSVPAEFEFGMEKIRDGEIWFSYRNSIFSIEKNKNENKSYQSRLICTLPLKERINNFFRNNEGQLWIGTVAGVWCYEHDRFQKMVLPSIHIKHINQQPDGNIWATTMDGIFILKDKRLLRRLDIKDGLPNSFVYAVLFDKTGNAWISTNNGLAKIDTAYHITAYSTKEGLQGSEFNTRGYCKGPDGTLYFAGVNGINFFKPEKLESKNEPSKTMLTGIEVNNQPYMPGLQSEYVNTISLPYDQNNIRLSFAYMDLTAPEKNQFKFWLKGFQDKWTLPQTNHTVQYILPHGDYQLLVLGANYEGAWSREPLVLNIHILPPWYQQTGATIIFILVAFVIVGAAFYFISKSRYQKKLRQLQVEKEIQNEKQRLSRDLHDNLGSQITWLSNNISQLEIAQQNKQPVEQKMNSLKEGAGELMKTLRETIWILNKDKISCIDLFDKVISVAARYVEVCPPMQLQAEENISPGIELNSNQALQVFRICQETINNTCKHSNASLLTITSHTTENSFTIRISDNGKGFDMTNEAEGHYGLQNMKQRAEESKLQLSIESAPGKGTTTSILLPDFPSL
ncbi:MAG: two-component regulator propeller domain-containing protein [Ferruginibacter sp.]